MNRPDPAAEPMDETDAAILAGVRATYDRLDPPPVGLDDRVRFALTLRDMDIEVSRLYEDTLVGARTSDTLRTMTFESDRLTIMITVTETAPDLRTVEGWLAPPGPVAVEIRFAGDFPTRESTAEPNGRFAFTDVPAGLARFTVPLPDTSTVVVTGPLTL